MPHLFLATLIFPMPVLAGVGNGEEMKVCLALEAVCADIFQGGALPPTCFRVLSCIKNIPRVSLVPGFQRAP